MTLIKICMHLIRINPGHIFRLPRGRGGGVLPYMGYIGMCGNKGYGLLAGLV